MSFPYRRRLSGELSESPAQYNRVLDQMRRTQQQVRRPLSPQELASTARLQLSGSQFATQPGYGNRR